MCDLMFPIPVMLGQAAPPKLRPGFGLQECHGCGRKCSPEARICDWCGIALAGALGQECAMCNTLLPPFVTYCGQCGIYFDPPPRLDPRNSALGEETKSLDFNQLPQWDNTPLPDFEYDSPPPPCKSTPTPEVPKYKNRAIQAPPILKATQSGSALPTKAKNSAVSPGNAFWRQQSEFVCRNHTDRANVDQEYRQKIADLRLGQLIDSNFEFLQSRSDGLAQSIIVGLKFARADHPDYPSSMDQSVRDLYQNIDPKVKKSNENESKKKLKKKIKPKTKDENSHLSHEEKLLLAELGPRGKGRMREVTQYIEQGANVNCRDYKGHSPLYNGK